MASANPFDLLGDFDNDDPSQLIAAAQQLKAAVAPKKTTVPSQQKPAQAKMPSKPLPPAEAVREAKSDGPGRGGRGGGRGFSRGRGRGVGFNRDSSNNEIAPNGVSGGYAAVEDGDIGKPFGGRGSFDERPRGAYRGGRRGGFNNGELGDGERPRRQFERRSGTGRGNELKRDGSGRGNWGSSTDEIVQESEEVVNANENLIPEKQPGEEDAAGGGNKENTVTEVEDKEPEEKEMTLEEYEKVLEEKRKALQALKTEERKVTVDKELESMQQLSSKKANNDIFIKLGSDKDKRKEIADREEKGKKSVNLNAFRKPSEAESFYSGGRGRGRGGRGYRGGFAGGSNTTSNVPAPRIEDQDQFPSLGGN